MSDNSFGAKAALASGGASYEIFRLDAVLDGGARLPYSLRVLLENLLRHEDGGATVGADDIEALAGWQPGVGGEREIAFAPARVLMQDFTGVPAIVDLAAMRDAMAAMGGDVTAVNPLVPVDLVIDHSIQIDVAGVPGAFDVNAGLEFERNAERYRFLRWGQQAFANLRVVPPNTGICHQVNLEYLASVVMTDAATGRAYPDTLVGTDSHTTMVNGLGVLGWGVGGIEAEAAMLGQPIPMLIPKVVGFKLSGALPEGATATDLVLTVTELLRRHGVVGKFVEFYGPGVASVPLENRATIGNMSPEYGSTCAIFPVDGETLRYLRFTGRSDELVALVEAYAKEQGLWAEAGGVEPAFDEHIELDLSTVVPCLAGPSRPQDRVPLSDARGAFRAALAKQLPEPPTTAKPPQALPDKVEEGSLDEAIAESFPASDPPSTTDTDDRGPDNAWVAPSPAEGRLSRIVTVSQSDGTNFYLDHGHVVIAAITSCTNTSNPSVMLAAGLLARNAVERGLQRKPWVKASLAPGSRVVMDYYDQAGLTPYLDKLGFNLVGYGCTTCIGNSGPLAPEISAAINEHGLAVAAVLSGNRNFEGRIHPDVRMNYLASPPLVVAYALAGSIDADIVNEPLGKAADGSAVYLRDIWPSPKEVSAALADALQASMYERAYGRVFVGDERWQAIDAGSGSRFEWSDQSTYIRFPSFLADVPAEPRPPGDVHGARVLAFLGDSVTTDHISPAGSIKKDGPAGHWLIEQGVAPADFNSYGSRRGNFEVMTRGTFANIRVRNKLVPGSEGGVTEHFPTGEVMSIYDASMRYQADGVPLVVLAGKEYGSGSSRDWAAKGTALLGVRAVIAESYERIHRSNLIGMGVLPLELAGGATAESLGLTGRESFEITGSPLSPTVTADGKAVPVRSRIDTPKEADYYANGGILLYVLRQLALKR